MNTSKVRMFYTLLIFSVCVVISICRLDDTEDYYKLLGVDKNASQEEIKRAFRKKARMYHPDKSKEKDAEEMFKKIGSAYEVLSDPKKRNEYDRYGAGGQFGQNQHGSSFNFQNFDFDDLFNNFDEYEDTNYHGHHRNSFGGGDFDMFRDFPNFFDEDEDRFGSGRSFFGEHFGSVRSNPSYKKQQTGRSCTTVTQRIGNTVTTYTTCS